MSKKLLAALGVLIYLVFSVVYISRALNAFLSVSPTSNTYDSPSYFNFEIFPAFRMQLITIPFSLIEDPKDIILFQSVVSIISWLLLTIAVIYFFNFKAISIISIPIVLLLGSSTVVLENNYMLTSESLNNSAIVLLSASTLYYFKTRETHSLAFFWLGLILVAGTKSASALSSFAIGVLFLTYLLINKKEKSIKVMSISLVSLVFLSFFAATALSSNVTKTLTTSGTINNRIWIDQEWRNQVVESGYPRDARTLWISYSQKNLGSPPDQAVVDSPGFSTWWESGGNNFLNDFMFRNLDYTTIGPFCLPCLNSDFKFDKTLIAGWSKGTSEYREYQTLSGLKATQTFFWPIKPEDSYLTLGIISLIISITLGILTFRISKLSKDLSNVFLVLLMYVFAYSLISWWFGSKPVDMTRHQLGSALTLRIIAVVALVYLLNLLIEQCAKYLKRIKTK